MEIKPLASHQEARDLLCIRMYQLNSARTMVKHHRREMDKGEDYEGRDNWGFWMNQAKFQKKLLARTCRLVEDFLRRPRRGKLI